MRKCANGPDVKGIPLLQQYVAGGFFNSQL